MEFPKKRKTEENGNGNGDSDSPPPPSASISSLTAEDIRKILQPFTQDQLLDLLQAAALRHPDVLHAIRSVADRDTTLRKLFVRGLAGETTTDTLRTVFSSFGHIDEAIVIFDKSTGKSKGYGFVTFKHVDGAILALKEPSKIIDGRMTVTQLAAAGVSGGNAGAGAAAAASDVSARKIFVGNVPFDISSERLLSQFLTYGEVEEGPLGFDKGSGKTKGFAFFVYKTEEGARASLVEPVKTIDGHQVNCKLAVDSKKGKPSGFAGDQQQQQQQQQSSLHGPMLISQYGGYGGGQQGNYGMQSSVPSYGNPVPSSVTANSGGYGHGVGGAYSSNLQFSGPTTGDYGGRLPTNPAGGFPDASLYGLTSSGHQQYQQHQQPMPIQRPAPGGMFQAMPPYY